MRTIDCEQGSEQWRLARLGKVGASMVADATARTKSGWGASRANLAARLVIERLTGNPSQSFITPAMQHGIDTEPEARRTYAFVHCVEVSQIGLVLHPTIDGAVASPDGLVHENGLVEIKCPQAARHLHVVVQWPRANGQQSAAWVQQPQRSPRHARMVAVLASCWINRIARSSRCWSRW